MKYRLVIYNDNKLIARLQFAKLKNAKKFCRLLSSGEFFVFDRWTRVQLWRLRGNTWSIVKNYD